jgi:hypothetical protein
MQKLLPEVLAPVQPGTFTSCSLKQTRPKSQSASIVQLPSQFPNGSLSVIVKDSSGIGERVGRGVVGCLLGLRVVGALVGVVVEGKEVEAGALVGLTVVEGDLVGRALEDLKQ